MLHMCISRYINRYAFRSVWHEAV